MRLITMLSSLEDMTVLPLSAILHYAPEADPARACLDLGTQPRPSRGMSRDLEHHWRVSIHLFDAMTQKSALSEKHDFVLENVFELQDDIGRKVIESLQMSGFRSLCRGPATDTAAIRKPTTNSCRVSAESYADRRETLESAIQHLSTAIERDPDFALAHAWLSYVSDEYALQLRPTAGSAGASGTPLPPGADA